MSAEEDARQVAAGRRQDGRQHVGATILSTLRGEEGERVYADIYGRPPPETERLERSLADLVAEIGRLPDRRKASVLKAMRGYPLLFASSAHANLFLRSEDFDAREGAVRMARYWETRERMFGRAAFDEDLVRGFSLQDYMRHYKRSEKVAADPDADATARDLAREFLRAANAVKIQSLDREIDAVPAERKAGLLEARRKSLEIASSDEHKLMFLKCDNFIASRAAKRMISYWETKYELFPPDLAHRHITLDDMKDDKRELELGACRLMPGTDKFGRCIITNSMSRLAADGLQMDGLLRVVWYVCHAAMECESCRENGIVIFVNHSNAGDLFDGTYQLRKRVKKIMLDSLPVRACALHIFFDSTASWWKKVIAGGLSILGTLAKMRALMYFGAGEESLFQLEEFGISRDQVPSELGGTVTFDDWSDWLEERRKLGL